MHVRCLGRQYNFPYVIARFANFYGVGQQLYRVIPRLFLSCYSGEKFGGENIFISTTTFENPEVFVPTEQVFSCESLPWLSLNDSIPKVDML